MSQGPTVKCPTCELYQVQLEELRTINADLHAKRSPEEKQRDRELVQDSLRDIVREERRFEAAKAAMAAYLTDKDVDNDKVAQWAVEMADALLAELEKT